MNLQRGDSGTAVVVRQLYLSEGQSSMCAKQEMSAYTIYGILPTIGAVSLFQGSMIFSLISHLPSTLTQMST
jgi:hypothetical protein